MSTFRLLLSGLRFHWRTHCAVILGVMAGTAVIGGALVVGDSVRSSLQEMTLSRLGEIDHALSTHRFFREDLADDLAQIEGFDDRFDAVAPALVLNGSLEHSAASTTRRSGRVNLYGLDDRLWELTEHGGGERPQGDEIILSENLARDLLGSQDGGMPIDPKRLEGQTVTLRIELPRTIPGDTLLGKRDQAVAERDFTVRTVLSAESGVGRLALNPNQNLPHNAFVELETLQELLDLVELAPTPRAPTYIPGQVNTLFVSAKSNITAPNDQAVADADWLNEHLSSAVALTDLQLRLVANRDPAYLSVESERQILETPFADAAEQAANELELRTSPVMIYLANRIENGDPAQVDEETEHGFSKYSIIAGIPADPLPNKSPFGPYEFVGESVSELEPDEILVNEWLAVDLGVEIGDSVKIRYHIVGSHGELPEEEVEFTVAGILKLDGTRAADQGITPEVEGITDQDDFANWDAPFPMDLPVTSRDDEYWVTYRTAPKAFIRLDRAQQLWRSRYGRNTSIRVAPKSGQSLRELETEFEPAFLGSIDVTRAGIAFRPVKQEGLEAASGTTDFTGLFLGFSFFLILAAVILIALLFRLGVERRSSQIGLLSAVGFTPRKVRWLFLAEGLMVVLCGAILGTVAAVGYAELMIFGLTTWWRDAVRTTFLEVSIQPVSLIAGSVGSVIVATIAVWWALRQLKGISTRDLLAGSSEPPMTAQKKRSRGRTAWGLAVGSLSTAVILVVAALANLIPTSEAFSGLSWQAVAFFVVGTALLVASLSLLAGWLNSDHAAAVQGRGFAGMIRLGLRNAARHRQRSVFTVGLIGSATFVIVAIAAGHRNPAKEDPVIDSGNGGFTLVAETTQPIRPDLNSPAGRRELQLVYREDQGTQEEGELAKTNNQLLEEMEVMPFRVKPGEEASCLNIYQTRLPTVIGAPQRMIDRGGFKFVGAKQANPWKLLDEPLESEKTADGRSAPVVPVFGDMNTLMYSLHKGVGDTIAVPDSENTEFYLKIVGMFDGSVLQGVLVMSESNFDRFYPDQAPGYEYFLIEIPQGDADDLESILETKLGKFGFDAEPVNTRLSRFLSVQNTYLSTFQALGGLGLLLGTFGLATVMLRNVLERRSELALLRAVGFRNGQLAGLVLCENAVLLTWGLIAGTISALLAMSPHLWTTGAELLHLALFVFGGLGVVMVIGMAASFFAVANAVRTPIVATLRGE